MKSFIARSCCLERLTGIKGKVSKSDYLLLCYDHRYLLSPYRSSGILVLPILKLEHMNILQR